MRKTVTLFYAAMLVSALAAGGFAQVRPALPAPGGAPAGSPVAKHGQLRVDGNKIVDKNGDPVTLRGMSFFWSNSEQSAWYSDAVVGWLVHDWKVSVLRAAMGVDSAASLEGGSYGGGGNPGYLANKAQHKGLVNGIVEAAIARGIYVIIDWHGHYLHPNVSAHANASREFFVEMAERWGAYPNVIYEIFNEPKNIGWSDITTYSNTVISSSNGIRSKDPDNIIILGTPDWSSQPAVSGNVSGTNLVYSMHFYAASHKGDYRNRVTSALGMGRSVFVSEFGTTNYDGDGAPDSSETAEWINFMETNRVSWVNWAIGNKNETSNIFPTTVTSAQVANWRDGSGPQLKRSGTIIREKIRQYNGSAYFSANPTYTAVATQPAAGGSIVKTPAKDVFNFGETVSFKATAQSGWELVGWTGDAAGTSDSISGRILGTDFNVSADFYQGGLVKNGHMANSVSGWNVSTQNSGAGTREFENPGARITVTATGSANPPERSVRFTQTGIALELGKKYKLTFDAKTVSGSRTLYVKMNNSASTREYLSAEAELSTTMKPFEFEFGMSSQADANAMLAFNCGNQTGGWVLSNVKLMESGTSTSSELARPAARMAAWSLSRAGGGITLRGPAEAGAVASLYDTRGRAVRVMQAKDGAALGAGVPAGSYLLVVKNAAGAEVLKSRVSLVK